MKARFVLALALVWGCRKETAPVPVGPPPKPGEVVTGRAAMGDWTADAPGVRRRLTIDALPGPYVTESADNAPTVVKRSAGASLRVPEGFVVDRFAGELSRPRQARVAPNGDVFVVESDDDRVRVLRDADGDGRAELSAVFASGLKQPFGVAFHPPADPSWVYVANTDSIVRFRYVAGDTKARGPAEVVFDTISGGGRLKGGGHWTRDVVFSRDGSKMWVSVGSRSNVSDDPEEAQRARIFEMTPDGKNDRVYASGIRNAVGLAVHPDTDELWASVNERDGLGDDLVPDYVTRVKDGGFYGWPWYYLGAHQDPRHAGKHPELAAKTIVPDVLLQSHSASLGLAYGGGSSFPEAWRAGFFAAQHGSWNRARRTGYKVVFIPTSQGRATGEYVDFMTGFVTPDGAVWGRPVGVAVARDGALLVTDDGGGCVWRVSIAR